MSLLQIKEPANHAEQRFCAAGIDLGTTHSLVAIVQEGQLEVLKDADGKKLLPSRVQYTDDAVIVGRQADLDGGLSSTKRLMGQSIQAVSHLGYDFADTHDGIPMIQTPQGPKTAIEVGAEILKVLWARAQQAARTPLKGAVITVPAYFDEAARKATMDAARLADIPVLRLLNEPTAAAVAYGCDEQAQGTFLIYDLGGGTFDVSLLKLHEGVFQVLATAGNTTLGGDDIDRAIEQWLQAQWGTQQSLRECAKQAKEALSHQPTAEIQWGDKQASLDHDTLFALVEPLLEQTTRLCATVLNDASVSTTDIDALVLVGGSTRMPLVRQAAQHWFGRKPLADLDPDLTVVKGAAIQADVLAGNRRDEAHLLLDVTPLSLGLETMGGGNEKMIARNTPLPAMVTESFTTYQDGQTGFQFHILQGERELAKDCRSLAHFTLKGLPPKPAGKVQVDVSFVIDADGLLTVCAQEQESGKAVEVQVKPTYGLDESRLTQMLQEAVTYADADLKAKQWQEKCLEAQQLCQTLRKTMAEDAQDFLTLEQMAQLEQAIEQVEKACSTDKKTLALAMEHLSGYSNPYIDQRLQAGLKKVLTGRSLSGEQDNA